MKPIKQMIKQENIKIDYFDNRVKWYDKDTPYLEIWQVEKYIAEQLNSIGSELNKYKIINGKKAFEIVKKRFI